MDFKLSSKNATPQEWPHGYKLLDDYEVIRVLGEGGMGKVYLVRSFSTGSMFAVKRAKHSNEADRKKFLVELQTWIDLPEHPNFVCCRFFRTFDAEILIFADYVKDGSLLDWIDSRRLYGGRSDQALERMLDIAIQIAWGLQCMHERGIIHQDIKPSNILISSDCMVGAIGITPQITDFGLAGARAAATGNSIVDHGDRVLVSSIRGTPAYWSPEQSKGMPATHKADIWSWGLSVMEMFTGGLTWISGLGAARVLEQYFQEDRYDEEIPVMPSDMVDLLRECFRKDPFDRLENLTKAVEKMQSIYRNSVGVEYSRILHHFERSSSLQTDLTERRYSSGTKWRDPQVWLERALIEAGRDPVEASAIVENAGVTRRGELVREMVAYDKAKRLYENLILNGKVELERDLATLCMGKALVHLTAADRHGALEEYDQALAIRERLTNQEWSIELATALAAVYVNKADTISDMGDVLGAVALCDQALSIWNRLINEEGHRELAEGLATTYLNKAIYVGTLGDKRRAVALYDQVIEIRERLVNQEGHDELAGNLARVYMNKANAVSDLGERDCALAYYDKSIAILEHLVNQDGRSELASDLARTYMNKANSSSALEDYRGAVLLYDQAILICERLVNQEDLRELSEFLVTIYMNKAAAVSALGDHLEAATLCDQAIAILERLVNQEGRGDLADDLARGYMNKGIGVGNMGDHRGATLLHSQAIQIRERLVNKEGRRELEQDLAVSYLNKANTAIALGDQSSAVTLYDQAIAIRMRLVNQEGRRELTGDLAQLLVYRGAALMDMNDKAKGLKDMLSAKDILVAEMARTGRTDLKQILSWLNQQF